MDCPIRREWADGERQRREGVPEDSEKTKHGQGRLLMNPWRQQANTGCREMREKRYQREEMEGGKKNTHFTVWGRPTLKVSVAEQRCGKCDHSFNLKLSGVNKEYVAGRDRGQDYWVRSAAAHFHLYDKKKKSPERETLNCLMPAAGWISQHKYSTWIRCRNFRMHHEGNFSMQKILHPLRLVRVGFLIQRLRLQMWCHSLQPLSQDKNNLKSDVEYAACGMCQRGLWELGHKDIE